MRARPPGTERGFRGMNQQRRSADERRIPEQRSHFEFGISPLGEADCQRLLMACNFGRVVYSEWALPAAAPVLFSFDGERLPLEHPGERLASLLAGNVVSLVIDAISCRRRGGWHVIATGLAAELVDTGSGHLEVGQLIVSGELIIPNAKLAWALDSDERRAPA
jgi:hypothetical protein